MLVNYIVTNYNQPTNKERKMTSFTTVYHQEKFIHLKKPQPSISSFESIRKSERRIIVETRNLTTYRWAHKPNDKRTVITCYLYRNLVEFV